MRVFNFEIQSAKHIYKVLDREYIRREVEPKKFHYLIGVYQSRMLGLCIHRSSKSYHRLNSRLEEDFQADLRKADDLLRQHGMD